MSSTKAVEDEYNGNKFLAIKNVDDNGKVSEKNIIGFGIKKAEAILDHIEEVKAWVAKHPKKRKTND